MTTTLAPETLPVRIGRSIHHVPAGSVVAQVRHEGSAVAYVAEPGGLIRCFDAEREIPLALTAQARVRNRLFER